MSADDNQIGIDRTGGIEQKPGRLAKFAEFPSRRYIGRQQSGGAIQGLAASVEHGLAEDVVTLEIGSLCNDGVFEEPYIDTVDQRYLIRSIEQRELFDCGKRIVRPIDSRDNLHIGGLLRWGGTGLSIELILRRFQKHDDLSIFDLRKILIGIADSTKAVRHLEHNQFIRERFHPCERLIGSDGNRRDQATWREFRHGLD